MTRLSKAPLAYQMTPRGPLPDPNGRYLTHELQAIQVSLQMIANMIPQSATEVPKVLQDGMQRYARDPWRPASGQSADAWVWYDAPAGEWKTL